MTTDRRRAHRLIAGLTTAAALAFASAAWSGPAFGADPLPSEPPSAEEGVLPDSTEPIAYLRVTSLPSDLAVLVDSVYVGRTPIDSLPIAPGTVRIRVLAPDPRRFDRTRDAADVTLPRGVLTALSFDLRPSVLVRSEPEPARVWLRAPGSPGAPAEVLLGETPLSVRRSALESGRVRLSRATYADSILPLLPEGSDSVSTIRVRLRGGATLASPPPPASQSRPLYRKGWFQWTLIGVGAALSGAAVAFHHKGDETYDRYLASTDVSEIPTLYDETVRYDRLAAASLAAGQICLISGLVLLATGQR